MQKYFEWNEEKNNLLKKERGITFEEIIYAIESGKLLAVKAHPNQEKYPNQCVYYVEVKGYVCMVPFVSDKDKIFLKTIFPSRKATRALLEKKL